MVRLSSSLGRVQERRLARLAVKALSSAFVERWCRARMTSWLAWKASGGTMPCCGGAGTGRTTGDRRSDWLPGLQRERVAALRQSRCSGL